MNDNIAIIKSYKNLKSIFEVCSQLVVMMMVYVSLMMMAIIIVVCFLEEHKVL